MRKTALLLFLIGFALLSSLNIRAQETHKNKLKQRFSVSRNVDLSKRNTAKHSKLIAIGLNLSLGVFGVHRLYLGTSSKVPIIYTFTLGGGGFLVLSDLGFIIFSKDLEQFANNKQIIMWNTEQTSSK